MIWKITTTKEQTAEQSRAELSWAEQIRGADKEIQMSRRFYGRPQKNAAVDSRSHPLFSLFFREKPPPTAPTPTPPPARCSCIFHMPEERVDWHFSQSKQKFFLASLYIFLPRFFVSVGRQHLPASPHPHTQTNVNHLGKTQPECPKYWSELGSQFLVTSIHNFHLKRNIPCRVLKRTFYSTHNCRVLFLSVALDT